MPSFKKAVNRLAWKLSPKKRSTSPPPSEKLSPNLPLPTSLPPKPPSNQLPTWLAKEDWSPPTKFPTMLKKLFTLHAPSRLPHVPTISLNNKNRETACLTSLGMEFKLTDDDWSNVAHADLIHRLSRGESDVEIFEDIAA